jgi:GGDEF domain-containing protein
MLVATPTPLTVSIGFAEHLCSRSILDTVGHADAALYAAKAAGRNTLLDGNARTARTPGDTA